MVCFSNFLGKCWKAIFIFAFISAALGVPAWISVPSNPTYAEKGSQILLNWTVSYDASSTVWRKWYRATESGAQIGLTIMTKYQTEAVQINRPEYRGRLEFVSNGAILLKNVSLADEGYIAFGVDFADGQFLKQDIMLNVTIPPSVLLGLPNKTIALEGRPFSTQCIFESRPTPMIKWYMNGDPLVNGSRFHIDSQVIGTQNNLTSVRSILTINKVIVNDTGRVSCSAEIPFGTLSSTGSLIVQYAPKTVSFTSNKANGIAILGETVRLTCNATSLPSASYEIRHNNVLIRNSTSQLLEIANALLADEGAYTCVAYNYIGYSAISSSNLTIYVRPYIKTPLAATTALVEGRTETIECEFKAKPEPITKWYFRGSGLANGSKFLITSVATENLQKLSTARSFITIRNIMTNDTGNLTCSAENPYGNASSSTDIIVHFAPKAVSFTSNKTNGIAILGQAVQFTCNATSLPSASYEIRHNNILIRNSTNQVYEIASTSLVDEGIYTCMAYNYIGYSARSSSNLTIYVPPLLHSHSNDITIAIMNSSTSLHCTFRGKPAPQITWYKMEGNNYKMINSTSRILAANASFSIVESTVEFQNLKRSDEGVYRCNAVNAAGESVKNMTLNVTYSPIATAAFKQNYTLVEDLSRNVTWQCKLESNPAGEINWYLDGNLLPSSGFQVVEKVLSNTSSGIVLESELTMIGVTRHKAGVLVCNASNPVGYSIEKTVIVVQYSPTNVSMLSEKYVTRNGSGMFELFCTFDANPAAEIVWKRNKTNIDNKSINVTELVLSSNVYSTRKKSVLRIDTVEEQLQGDYQCIATNQQGSVTQKTQLIVQYVPKFLIHLEPLLIKNHNETAVLQCKVQSNPLAQIEWYKNGNRMHNGSNVEILHNVISQNDYHSVLESTFSIRTLSKRDSGNYTCKSQNAIGSRQSHGKFIVQYGPEITPSFANTINLTETALPVILSCNAEAHPRPNVQWFYNGKIYHGNVTESDVELTDARSVVRSVLMFSSGIKRSDNGTYTCNASNLIGSMEKSVKINVWYGPEVLSQLNGTKSVPEMSNVTFECKAEGHPVPMIQWYKSGKKLQSVPITTTTLSDTKALVESSLVLRKVTKNDTAEYKCEVTNTAGRKERIATLSVLFQPVLPMIPPNITANQSQRVELNCFADANPPVMRYNWTKDGISLAETAALYVISSAQETSTGLYTCQPIYSLGVSGIVIYNLHIQVPAHITKKIECTKSATKLICSCEAHGIPTPRVFWTKGNSPSVLESGNAFNISINRGQDGRYHCNAVNKLATAVDTYNVFLFDQPVGEWTAWGSCNTSCGEGFQQRTRPCIYNPCTENLLEFLPCNGSCMTTANITTSQIQKSDDEVWSIVLYVMIPVLLLMAIILVVWLANIRGCRREEKEFIVPLNNNLSQPPSLRSMPTRRGIFLPGNNFGVINSGYRPDGNDAIPSFDRRNYDTVEVEMQFGNDIGESRTEETPIRESRGGAVGDKDLIGDRNDVDEEGALSFYNSAYTHL